MVGVAADATGISALKIGNTSVNPTEGAFDEEVALAEGANSIRVTAEDGAGNQTSVELEVHRFTLPVIAILAPEDATLVLGTTTEVSGTISDPTATVEVNGIPAQVVGSEFVAQDLPIGSGANLFKAVITTASGRQAADSITLFRDLTPPRVVIEEPRNGSRVFEPTLSVTGMVNDIVVGTVNSEQATVTVNGQQAEVSNRSFRLDRITLSPGENVITATAVDPSGNRSQETTTVHFEAPDGPTIAIFGGDGQSSVIGSLLPAPLSAMLRDRNGAPVAGELVTFRAVGNDGSLDVGLRQVALSTDGNGLAQVGFTLGRRAGNQTIEATAVGFSGRAVFNAIALPAQAALLVPDSGDQQVGISSRELPEPLVVVVTDSGFNRLGGIPVTFEIVEGEGQLENGLEKWVVVSDSDGRAAARLTLGAPEGVANNVVQARLGDEPDDPAVAFTAAAQIAGHPSLTTISGLVLDNTDLPVPGVTVTVAENAAASQSDNSGFFHIIGAPVGALHLIVDGSTAQRPGSWPTLEFTLTAVPGRDNSLGRPIFLLPLATQNALFVDEGSGGVLTIAEIPGFSLEVAPGSVTFPDGSSTGVVTVTPVHSDKIPMTPGFGQQPRFIVTIQPAGAKFDPPAPLTLPNVDGMVPGEVTELYSFDHDLGQFVSIGPGTVSDDGTRITSNKGVGIVKAGWHCGGNPGPPGWPHDCPLCRRCVSGICVPDSSQTPLQFADDDCLFQGCAHGTLLDFETDLETPPQIADNCFNEICPRDEKRLDLNDAPLPLECCGNLKIDLPEGRLTGIYDPDNECCVDDGLLIVDKGPPLDDIELCPQRSRPPLSELPYDYQGCSVPAVVTMIAGFHSPNNPAGGQSTHFSDFDLGPAAQHNLPCDVHDACFQSCKTTEAERTMCDDDWQDALLRVCELAMSHPVDGQDLSIIHRCFVAANVYFQTVSTLGKFFFEANQKDFCQCCD